MSSSPTGNRRVSHDDPLIPAFVRQIWPEGIPAIFVRGEWPIDAPALAIVGATDPVPYARTWAFRLGQEAARRGWVVVSGLARGIDAAAHEGALAGGGITVAVVANGLDTIFPIEHASLVERIIEQGGAIVSISPPGTLATRERLLLRNQLTSAFSRAVIAVQARGRGGSLATMRHAVLQRRFIAACTPPVSANDVDWEGNALLLGSTPPWPDRDIDWWPALPVDMDQGLETLFAVLDALPDPVDAGVPLRETPVESQLRLLEERAPYRFDAPESSERASRATEGE